MSDISAMLYNGDSEVHEEEVEQEQQQQEDPRGGSSSRSLSLSMQSPTATPSPPTRCMSAGDLSDGEIMSPTRDAMEKVKAAEKPAHATPAPPAPPVPASPAMEKRVPK